MKVIHWLLLSAVGPIPVAAQQIQPTHHWATIVQRPDARVELDTGSVASTDQGRRVWLRWTFPTGMADFSDMHLEQREVDCVRPVSRVVSRQDVSVFDGSRSFGRPEVVSDSAARWRGPGRGSLDAAVVAAVCGGAKAGA